MLQSNGGTLMPELPLYDPDAPIEVRSQQFRDRVTVRFADGWIGYAPNPWPAVRAKIEAELDRRRKGKAPG